MRFILNNTLVDTDVPPGTVTLDYIRNIIQLKGTKEVCREGDCGACTLLLGELRQDQTVLYKAVCSCILPLGDVEEKHLVTIEGINQTDLTPVQQAFVDHGATQCGFCTPGFVISLTGLLLSSPALDDVSVMDAVAGNVCRCTGYTSIIRAIHAVADQFKNELLTAPDRIRFLIEHGIIPQYFHDIPQRLQAICANGSSEGLPGQDAVVVAGGTDLYVQRPDELKAATLHFTLKHQELADIWTDDGHLYVGAAVVTEEFRRHALLMRHLPHVSKYIALIASRQIRERATLAGNIVNASPIGDMTIMLLALNAELGLQRRDAKRTVALRAFYKGYKQFDLRDQERIEWIRIPLATGQNLFHFEKVSKRTYLDIASVNSAMCASVTDHVIQTASIAAGGVSPIPLYLKNTSDYLAGQKITAETMQQAAKLAVNEISPISDVRGSAAYKTLLLRQLIYAHFLTLFPEKKLEEGLL